MVQNPQKDLQLGVQVGTKSFPETSRDVHSILGITSAANSGVSGTRLPDVDSMW